jgi:hypothetical protein
MGNAQFLNIVSNSLVQDKLVAEEELGRLILLEDESTEIKLQKIKDAVKVYGDTVSMIAFWESYIKDNITFHGEDKDHETPTGNNN